MVNLKLEVTGTQNHGLWAYFAHHQGMTIAAICNTACEGYLRDIFHRESSIKATELLVQERAPNHLPVKSVTLESDFVRTPQRSSTAIVSRRIKPVREAFPVTHLLSNGRYSVMLTAEGSGYSRWRGIAINRWREDPTFDNWGLRIFLRDLERGSKWTAHFTPGVDASSDFEAIFSQEKAEFHRVDQGISTTLECHVSNENDAEVRSLQLVNATSSSRRIEITTYMESRLSVPGLG